MENGADLTATYPHLLSPLDAGRLHLRNRVVFPAHQTLFSEHGVVSDRRRAYYVERARGGPGMVFGYLAGRHAAYSAKSDQDSRRSSSSG